MCSLKHKITRGESGQVVIIATLFFLIISLTVVLSLAFSVTRGLRVARDIKDSRQSLVLAESLNEDIVYRLVQGMNFDTTETLTIDGQTAIANITNTVDGKDVTVEGDVDDAIRRVKTSLELGGGTTFSLGVQVGNGGFIMDQNSKVVGNVYSNGDIIGSNGATITNSAIASGGLIDDVDIGTLAGDEAWAHEITDSTVTGNLYCQTGTGNNKACNTSRSDPATTTFPVTQENIDAWTDAAEAGGIHTGDYNIGSDVTLGPLKITGNLTFTSNNKTLTLLGPLWVEGNITTANGSTIKPHSSYGPDSEVIVSEGLIDLSNVSNFLGSGDPASYVMLLTTSNSINAIDLGNNAGAVILNAQNGRINFSQNAGASQATADTIFLDNSAEVIYESGLADIHFTSGPSAGFEITSWEEIE